MSVFKRSTSAGATAEYHYAFMQGGKRYFGVCEGCTTKAAADEYEKNIKGKTKQLSQQKSARALVENFRDDLTGGIQISLESAYDLSLQKPRDRTPSLALANIKRSYWLDFCKYMAAMFPEVSALPNVRHTHAEAYIQYLRDNGRYDKQITYKRAGTRETTRFFKGHLSAKTLNTYQRTLSEVFSLLARDAGIIDNPFNQLPKLKNKAAGREAFSDDELALIRDNLNDFVRPLFYIAIATALREGDICLLKWDEIDFKSEVITRCMNKTENIVEIPIIPPLKAYLSELYKISGKGDYVLPEHAEMYLSNRTGVSYRVRMFLEGIGIKTSKKVKGRAQAVSIKDLHSCRHTFCYYAGIYGTPLNIVQSIVGHMTPEMTKHYSKHATLQAKRSKMELLPDFMGMKSEAALPAPKEDIRAELIRLIDSMPDDAIGRSADLFKALSTAAPDVLEKIEKILNLR